MADPTRFERLREIVFEAHLLAGEARSAYLERACAGDAELRREAALLLEHDQATRVFLEEHGVAPAARDLALADAAGGPPAAGPPAACPARIGPYTIQRVLGEGGMGIVYEATQQNPRRSVALKVVRGGWFGGGRGLQLFAREVRTLALLKHPGIAAIHDAGKSEDGQHYFAMELVQGAPLDLYLRQHPLGAAASRQRIAARLGLFRRLCDAVGYAHQRGVIHRDLKPSNVMVVATEAGGQAPAEAGVRVKILDFGLARITGVDVSMTTMVTEVGRIEGTLAYMSPEQARGDPDAIDLRSDVYSLGVILYELLTEQRPYDVRRSLVPEAIRVICDQEPARPSGVVRSLRGDLETIVLKALAKDPEQRYGSVLALVEDIDRYLADQPILARPPSASYQIRKFVARHKAPVASLVAALLLIVAFGISMSVMYGIQTRERQHAEREARKAERINAFMQEILGASHPAGEGREVTVREMLEAASEKIDQGLAGEPEIEAAVRLSLATTYQGLDRLADSEGQLRRALAALDRAESDDQLQLAKIQTVLGVSLYYQHSDASVAEAESLWTAAIKIRERLLGASDETAMLMSNLAVVRQRRGDAAGAERLFRDALEMTRRHFGDACENCGPEDDCGNLSFRMQMLAGCLERRGRIDEAEPLFRQALSHSRRFSPEGVAFRLAALAGHVERRGRFEEAEPLYREAIERGDRGSRAEPTPPRIGNRRHLGSIRMRRGGFAEAERLFREARELLERTPGSETRRAILQDRSSCEIEIGRALTGQGRLDQADRALGLALAATRERLGSDHPQVAAGQRAVADLRRVQARDADAETLVRGALGIYRAAATVDSVSVAATLLELAAVRADAGRPRQAESALRDCLELQALLADRGDRWITAAARNELANCLAAQGRLDEEAERCWSSGSSLIAGESAAVPFAIKLRALERTVRALEEHGRHEESAPYRARLAAMRS